MSKHEKENRYQLAAILGKGTTTMGLPSPSSRAATSPEAYSKHLPPLKISHLSRRNFFIPSFVTANNLTSSPCLTNLHNAISPSSLPDSGNMDTNGYYSFNQNALPYARISPFQHQDDTFVHVATVEQTPAAANDTFTAEGTTDFTATAGNFYAFNENNLPQPAENHLYQPVSNTYQEMLEGQYAFNQFALPQPAVTNAFEFNNTWGASTSVDEQALQDTLTELNNPGWPAATADPTALSGDTTGGLRRAVTTGSDLDAPFEVDESGFTNFHPPSTSLDRHRSMEDSLACSWPGCFKTSPFKTQRLLETHLENIHLNPLYCTQPGCDYRRPFPKKGDLDRHLATKHGIGRLFRCPKPDCPRHKRPFGRKDKLRAHVNLHGHGLFRCQFDHCTFKRWGLLTKEDVSKHEEAKHCEQEGKRIYECAVGSCEGSKSGFSESEFKHHALGQHNIRYSYLKRSILPLLKPGQQTINTEDFNSVDDECYCWEKGLKTTCDECDKSSGKTTS